MAAYTRSTRECSIDQLRPELSRALREYIQTHAVGNETEIIMCCETTSVKKETGALSFLMESGPDAVSYTAMLITADRLMWARSGDKSKTVVVSANLKDIRVNVFDSSILKDTGLEINGYPMGAKWRHRGYIGLGPEPAAQKFCEEVRKAAEKANPPAKGWRGLFSFLSFLRRD